MNGSSSHSESILDKDNLIFFPPTQGSLAKETSNQVSDTHSSRESIEIGLQRQSLISSELQDKYQSLEHRLCNLENHQTRTSQIMAEQLGIMLQSIKQYQNQDLNKHFIEQSKALAKQLWQRQASSTGYYAQGTLLILYTLTNNLPATLTSEVLDILCNLAKDLEYNRMTREKRKVYTELLYESGINLSGHD